ncbi:rCG60995 [Rattus norvegicus]|uniref:RCG60995 n=1 Tax=Rattus norvegicus TaxID=10116 RepID=A6JKQ8_RAT|nr:rCG60995 [Rattus norvegicus]
MREPCNPFSGHSKQTGASHLPDGMVQRCISKLEPGKPAALRRPQRSGCRSTPGSEVLGASHAVVTPSHKSNHEECTV